MFFLLTLGFFMFGLIDVSAFSEKDELFSKWISSYALKTLLLFEWEENPAEEQWAGSNLSDRFLNILNNLVHCLKKGSLRSFFYNDYNVLPKEDINNFKTHPVHRVTILHQWILSIRNASKYKFEDCLKDIFNEVKLTCQKMKLTHLILLSKGMKRHFHQELNQVITRTTKETDSIMIFKTYIFCDIYLQALLNKIAPEEKLILIDVKQMKETVSLRSLRKGIELFKDIANTRINGLENLPSYSVWTQEFKSAGNEIAKLFEFLFSLFKKDVKILLNKLKQS